MAVEAQAPSAAAAVSPPAPATVRRTKRAERDDVFWTELEVRRLGNIVAEMIQSRRYIGLTPEAKEERALMRQRLDAMRRKSLRVLVRAELHVKSSQTTWPGLDPMLTQPVNLAEEYVRTVANYLAVLEEEEETVTRAVENDVDVGGLRAAEAAEAVKRAADKTAGTGNVDEIPTIEEVTAGVSEPAVGETGDISYREALARDRAESGSSKPADLLGSEGLRQRKVGGKPGVSGASRSGTGKYSKEDEELMKSHQPVQDQLTNDLVDLVGRLKGNLTEINSKIVKDGKVIDEAEDAVDKNLSGIGKQRDNLDKYSRSTSTSWWTIWILLVVVLFTFLVVFALMKVPI